MTPQNMFQLQIPYYLEWLLVVTNGNQEQNNDGHLKFSDYQPPNIMMHRIMWHIPLSDV